MSKLTQSMALLSVVLVSVSQISIARAQTVQGRAPLVATGYVTSTEELPGGGFVTASSPIVNLGSASTANNVAPSVENIASAANHVQAPEGRTVNYYAPATQQGVGPIASNMVAPPAIGTGTSVPNADGWHTVRSIGVSGANADCYSTTGYMTGAPTAVMQQGPMQQGPMQQGPVQVIGVANTVPALATPVQGPPVKKYRPLIPLRRHVPNGSYVSQGMFGQPKAYVQGQGVRNFIRYILP